MTDFQEQAVVAQRANLDFFFGLAGTMLEGEEKLVRLNLDMTKATFADWHQRAQDRLAKKDGEEVADLQNANVLPAVDKVLTYERQFAEITSAMQTQLAEVVNAQSVEVNRQAQWFVENVSQNTQSAPNLHSRF
jgi:phasin family protein